MSGPPKLTDIQTRRRTGHWKLGQPADFSPNLLPLEVDVFNKFRKLREADQNKPTKELAWVLLSFCSGFAQEILIAQPNSKIFSNE